MDAVAGNANDALHKYIVLTLGIRCRTEEDDGFVTPEFAVRDKVRPSASGRQGCALYDYMVANE